MNSTFEKQLSLLLAAPTTIFTLIALIAIILAFIRIKKITITTSTIIHVALMVALTVILHMFRLYHMPQGGSVTFGGMVPLLFIAFRYGPAVGYLAGFVYGLINLIQDPFILQPVQVLFDYPLPYMAIGLAGYFKNIYLGAFIGILGRFICHFISGIVFFANYTPAGMSPYWYSFIFNASYLIPELIICIIILRILPVKRLLTQIK
ncbi:energy-coupled thiamine transporter ThiT [Pectinatus brassicae]|uniref:Thiamine transporter n=1 Tax=Pectinatus brassicae TaxID=862415 RepID=A0A840US03_9FIRM|nr:energy-coupled thiamine transporter ThiT [Pectinatus brassicae]MBB5337528.1 thiamine transporter [Pectinatus brassicae]